MTLRKKACALLLRGRLLIAAILLPAAASAQLSVRVEYAELLTATTNTNVNIGFRGMIPDNSNEKVALGPGRSTALLLQYARGRWWAELGVGVYKASETHGNFDSYLITGEGHYRDVHVPIVALDVPVRVGCILYREGGLGVSVFAGTHMLIERLRGYTLGGYNEEKPMRVRGQVTYPTSYYLDRNGAPADGVFGFNPGLRASYAFTPRISAQADAHLTIGFRVLSSSGIFVTQYRDIAITENSYATTKGDALGLSIGIAYSFGRQRQEADSKSNR